MKMKNRGIVGVILILLGFLLVLHHLLSYERFFDLQDIFNHEFFEAILFTAGLVILASSRYHGE